MASEENSESGQPSDASAAEGNGPAGADGRADADRAADSSSRAQDEAREAPSASQDLADGLDLMLRAMRKAVKEIESGRIEELGQKARQHLQRFDRSKVEELRRRAQARLDPRRLEDIAEEAGRELLRVVERITDRFDSALRGHAAGQGESPAATEEAKDQDRSESSDDSEGSGPRVRVE